MKRNLTIISIIAVVVLTFGLVAVAQAQAQPQAEAPSYSIGSVNNTNQTGSSYSSTVYAVGDNSAPSSAPGARGISGPRRDFDTGAESGQSDESPVGEPFVLLLMAALFAAVVAFRTRNSARSSVRTRTCNPSWEA